MPGDMFILCCRGKERQKPGQGDSPFGTSPPPLQQLLALALPTTVYFKIPAIQIAQDQFCFLVSAQKSAARHPQSRRLRVSVMPLQHDHQHFGVNYHTMDIKHCGLMKSQETFSWINCSMSAVFPQLITQQQPLFCPCTASLKALGLQHLIKSVFHVAGHQT